MQLAVRNKLIILDRDGVINVDKDDYVKSAEEWEPIPGSIDAIANLSQLGFAVAIATNQSGVGREYFDLAALDAMHDKMCSLVKEAGGTINAIAFCPHLPDADCQCRKPMPGLVHQIEESLGRSAKDAFFIGDKLSDIHAAEAGGCIPILVRTGKGLATEKSLTNEQIKKYLVFDSLAAFTRSLADSNSHS